jgi:hypothetical protein
MIDFYSDKGMNLLKKMTAYYPQGLLSLASDFKEADFSKHGSYVFADRKNKLFPLFDKEHIVLSYMYADFQKADAEVIDNIKTAAYIHKLPVHLFQHAVEPIRKEAMFEENIVTISNIDEARKVMKTMEKSMNSFDYKAKKEAITKLAEFIPPTESRSVATYTGKLEPNKRVIYFEMQKRASLAKAKGEKKAEQFFDALSNNIDKVCAKRMELHKFADFVEKLDNKMEFDQYYDRELRDPFKTFFSGSKIAMDSISIAGKSIPVNVIQELDPASLGDVLGEDMVSQFIDPTGIVDINAFQNVISALPMEVQNILLSVIPTTSVDIPNANQ